MNESIKCVFALALLLCLILSGPAALAQAEESWQFGFGKRQIVPPEGSRQPLYIAGYHNGVEITGTLDYCEARAVWLDAGGAGLLLIGVDCVALDSGAVEQIRARLADIPDCLSVNVYATHTHAGPDTLGLWGPVGVDGKNSAYMKNLIAAAAEAGREAAANPHEGRLFFGYTVTEDMYRDSRYPSVYDPNLYQLRFKADDGSAGTRIYFYGAHAESLRGNNTLVSRDFPGHLCDGMTELTGDNTMFCSGPAGGLIMTKAFVNDTSRQAVENLEITARKLIEYASSITPENERELKPLLQFSRTIFTVPLDNPVFALYKMLGILGTKAVKADSVTGHGVETELAVLMLGDLAVALIPGEIFPELVLGGETGRMNPDGMNPRPLDQIAAENGIEQMVVVGLCNDELGYIVPPSDFLVNLKAPYIERIRDALGEDHYEETNSVGPACAQCIADAFEAALKKLK